MVGGLFALLFIARPDPLGVLSAKILSCFSFARTDNCTYTHTHAFFYFYCCVVESRLLPVLNARVWIIDEVRRPAPPPG